MPITRDGRAFGFLPATYTSGRDPFGWWDAPIGHIGCDTVTGR
jgi:hypothetical protein